jgi:hypothetical protein
MRNSRQFRKIVHFLLVALPAGLIFAASASATEPRPWLCRQIPVFSAEKAMTWRATQRGAGHWILTFMHYDPAGGGHDGFTVVSTHEVNGGEAYGTLDPGQYYAVALHRAGPHWICPANASETHDAKPAAISNLCYGEAEDSCDVTLTVSAAGANP